MKHARLLPVLPFVAISLCVGLPAAFAGSTVTLTTSLTGSEVSTGGDLQATGSASLVVDKPAKQLCYTISWSNVTGSVTAAHLHSASAGQVGPHFLDLFNTASYPGTGSVTGCVAATQSQLSALVKTPSNYYVNLHSTAYPSGALRGQLGD